MVISEDPGGEDSGPCILDQTIGQRHRLQTVVKFYWKESLGTAKERLVGFGQDGTEPLIFVQKAFFKY
jgi:hypothetical protein